MVQTSLWLVSVKRFLKRAYAWFKKNWQLVVGFCLAVVLFVLARGKFDISAYLEKIREGYGREIDAIDKSHKIELKKREEALRIRDESIREAEKNLDKNIINLEERKRKIADDLLRDENSNDKIAEGLSDITGIDIHD